MNNVKVHFVNKFRDLPPDIRRGMQFDGCNPFFCSEFIEALEKHGCVSEATGWRPEHLWLSIDNNPVFFMPLYRKSHSWGEYVFDQAWAQAYERHGFRYYPKWITAVPFTPSVGPRWWSAPAYDDRLLLQNALEAVQERLGQNAMSGWHLLFANTSPVAEPGPLLARKDTQFHWFNRGYETFDDFLSGLKSRKRKNIRRERLAIRQQGVKVQRKSGADLNSDDWSRFYQCYRNTYEERGRLPYLSEAFFQDIGQSLAQNIVMVQAFRDQQQIAAALCFFSEDCLFGRYWGAVSTVDYLHFEVCFYQGIEYCIERGLQRFDPGTQGEHKLIRGFEPWETTSWHFIPHPGFREAIAKYLTAEAEQVEFYRDAAGQYLPFKQS